MLAYGRCIHLMLSMGLLLSACATEVAGTHLPTMAQAPYAFDQHRSIQILPSSTAAILDVTYYQRNVEYLLEGSKRAILIDSGPGKHKIAPVISSLTSLPVTVVPSHLHYDHVGGLNEFTKIALPDAEDLRKRTVNGVFTPLPTENLGHLDGEPLSPIHVTQWLQHNERIDLGQRVIEILVTPGHTKTSVMIFDPDMPALFTGDFIYPGGLFVESLEDYQRSLAMLLAHMPKEVTIYPAHNTNARTAPTLSYHDLVDLHQAVSQALQGTLIGQPSKAFGIPAIYYPVNQRMHIFHMGPHLSGIDYKFGR